MASRKGNKKHVPPPSPVNIPKRKTLLHPGQPVDPLLLNMELHALFKKLHSIHAVMCVCIDAAQAHNSETETEVANVLRRHAEAPLYSQLTMLKEIIESLGGKTSMSGEDKE